MTSAPPPSRYKPIPILSTSGLDPNKHAAEWCAIQMTLVHNVFIRAINSIYYHAPLVKSPQDIRDFFRFCQAFVSAVDAHHHVEETIIFPGWVEMTHKPDLMQENVIEHAAFHDGLERLKSYAMETPADGYSHADFIAIVDGFGPPLISHLTNEIDSVLTMREYPEGKVLEAWKKGEKAAGDHLAKDEQIPFGLGCNDVTFEGGKHNWPPIPWFLQFTIAWWYGRKYQGAWRFCSSDLYGKPRKPVLAADAA